MKAQISLDLNFDAGIEEKCVNGLSVAGLKIIDATTLYAILQKDKEAFATIVNLVYRAFPNTELDSKHLLLNILSKLKTNNIDKILRILEEHYNIVDTCKDYLAIGSSLQIGFNEKKQYELPFYFFELQPQIASPKTRIKVAKEVDRAIRQIVPSEVIWYVRGYFVGFQLALLHEGRLRTKGIYLIEKAQEFFKRNSFFY